MASQREFILPIEWEVFNRPITITSLSEHERLPKGQKKVVVDRDEDYNLRAVMQFEDHGFQSDSDNIPGSFAEYFNIRGSDSKSFSYTLESAILGGLKYEISAETGFSGTASIQFQGLRMKTEDNNDGTHLTEWCLNGPENLVFCRTTQRKVQRALSRERLESEGVKLDYVETPLKTSSSRTDFLRIRTEDKQFLVAKVPDGIGPNWSSNLAIEYRKAWGGIPDVNEREKILEICSFVFGRQLLLIGYTLYDQNENVVETYSCSPWGRSAKSFCSKPDWPPINIGGIPPADISETVIGKLLSKYRELREYFCLKEALWNYWVYHRMPLGSNLPILAAGIESIINGWFHYNKSKSKGAFLEKDEFITLLKDELKNVQKKLEVILGGEKIVEKILRANEFGVMERYRVFFQEIGLTLAQKDWDAIKGRHIFVHGGALFDKTDWRKVAMESNTFETLFNKIFLKLLEYSGTFIDRSTAGWPEAQLT